MTLRQNGENLHSRRRVHNTEQCRTNFINSATIAIGVDALYHQRNKRARMMTSAFDQSASATNTHNSADKEKPDEDAIV